MAESSDEYTCNNCGSKYQLTYDTDEVSYEPDNCPFCGDVVEQNEEFGFVSEDSIWDTDPDLDLDEDEK
jgi:transcription initiation factor IIE alpha subunit